MTRKELWKLIKGSVSGFWNPKMKYTPENFISGVIEQPKDKRDYIFKAAGKHDVPVAYMNKNTREIENQYDTSSCVANAAVSALEMMYTKGQVNLSRMFVYYNAREPYSYLKEQDIGAYVRDGFKSVMNKGVCPESTWKFSRRNLNARPSEKAYQEALDNKVLRYERLTNIMDIKYAVSLGQGVTFGIPIKSDFFYLTGPLEEMDYKASGSSVGGHAMSIVGYNDKLKGFIIENSWGAGWGDAGLALISYDIFEKYYFDVWTASELNFEISKVPEIKPEPVVEPEKEPETKIEKDNLIKIVGIGKVYQGRLNDEGYFTYKAVSEMNAKAVQMMETKYHFHGDFRNSVKHAKTLQKAKLKSLKK